MSATDGLMVMTNEYESITDTDNESDIKNQLKDGIIKVCFNNASEKWRYIVFVV